MHSWGLAPFGDVRQCPARVLSEEAHEAIMKISDVLTSLIGTRYSNCPHEAAVLAYSENRLSPRNRAQIERHFSNCHDCLEVLAFLGRETHETPAPLTEEDVSEQTNKVLYYMRNEGGAGKQVQLVPRLSGFRISYPKLATVGLVISAIVIAVIVVTPDGPSPSEIAMDAMKLAVRDKRYSLARVSGGFDHSPYAGTLRGDDEGSEGLLFDRAEIKAKAAAQVTSDSEAGLISARSHLIRGASNEANQALLILEQLAKGGVETPEALNDLGVAQFQRLNYDEAIDYFTRALEKSPGYGEALFNRALAYQRLDRNDEARQDWQQFISQSPNDGWKDEAMAQLRELNTPSDR